MSELIFPLWMYNPDGRSFWCPSEEFLNSLKDSDRWESEPFSGPRKKLLDRYQHSCSKSEKLETKVAQLELEITHLKQELVEYQIQEASKKEPFQSSFAKKIASAKKG